ncbi:murein L,D-transpeptidase catalytic domain family protein [Legionella gresilensis]|uniref:murein L,D-transpeptidase catalytic domain family protein n=1 Tax=Legionella gresilensis TaxID=91823 RepID=UPI001041BB5C|nr:murein L,D-transpeptidase catalytic domain family protein [Legionella gresilensis]
MNTILSLLSAAFFSSSVSTTNLPPITPSEVSKPITQTAVAVKKITDINQQVQQLSQKAPELNKKVLRLALAAYQKASNSANVKKPVLTVIDYSLPSSKQRMWVFDLQQAKLLYNTYVAHGKNSGTTVPHHFSNKMSSKETSLGTYVTRDTYIGSKGLSLNLQGLEKGINDNAYNRRVVIHGAWYVEPSFIKKAGQAGRSWGCPSIAKTLAKPVINTLKGGSVVFAYYPDKYYLSHSGFVLV